jgi:hypothetical protein
MSIPVELWWLLKHANVSCGGKRALIVHELWLLKRAYIPFVALYVLFGARYIRFLTLLGPTTQC